MSNSLFQFNLTTTGTVPTVEIEELGLVLTHPETIDLLEKFSILDVIEAMSIQQAIQDGTLRATNEDGVVVASSSPVAAAVAVASVQASVATIEAGESMSGLMPVTFWRNGDSGDKWLRYMNDEDSNVLPFIVPLDGGIKRITVNNERYANFSVDIYVNGLMKSSADFTSTRSGVSPIDPNLDVKEGDAISVYSNRSGGTKPNNMVVVLYYG